MTGAEQDAGPRGEGAPSISADDGFHYASSELEAMAFAPNYYRAIHELFAPHLGPRIAEVGAGVGTFSERLLATPGLSRLTLIEPARNNFPVLERRFRDDPRVVTISGYLEDVADALEVDALVLVNVLEHVEDDRRFVRAARQALVPGGKLLIFVPALPILYGALDRAFEHHRRYTRRGLMGLLSGGGFRVLDLRFANLPGALSWFLVGRVLRRRTLSPRQVRIYDRFVVPGMTSVEKLLPPPFGQSLIAIAEAPP